LLHDDIVDDSAVANTDHFAGRCRVRLVSNLHIDIVVFAPCAMLVEIPPWAWG
jgi:hypothetical protein